MLSVALCVFEVDVGRSVRNRNFVGSGDLVSTYLRDNPN